MKLPDADELAQRAAGLLRQWRVADSAVRVVWNDRLTTTAGRAFLRNARIELNPRLLAREPGQLPAVLAHEVAHIAAFRLFGPNIPAHGRQWRSLMRLAGHEPDVTHRIPVDDVRRGRRGFCYLRVCDHCGDRTVLTSVRYGRCQRCSNRGSYLVMKAPATAAGRKALAALSLAEVRAACRAES